VSDLPLYTLCVCVDTRRGAGSGLAKQKIRKKRNQEGNDRSLCTLATTSAGRTFNTNGSSPSPFAHLFFRQFIISLLLLFTLWSSSLAIHFWKQNKWRNEDLRQSFSFVLRFSELLSELSIKRRAISFRNNRHSFLFPEHHIHFYFPDNLFFVGTCGSSSILYNWGNINQSVFSLSPTHTQQIKRAYLAVVHIISSSLIIIIIIVCSS
jgi:hypothetical protein